MPKQRFSQVVSIKTNKTNLLEFYKGEKESANLNSVDEKCTSLEPAAPFTGELFEQLSGQCFAKLNHRFICFGWHEQDGHFHFAKDPLNPKPIYWMHFNGGLIISSNIQAIKDALGDYFALSEDGLASWLSGYPNPAVSLFKNINVLPIGYRLKITQGLNVEQIKFWDIDPEFSVRHARQDDYAAHFYDLLAHSVQESIKSSGSSIVSQMSGGLDSTSITAIANKCVKNTDTNLLPLSHIYTQSEQCDEQTLVDDMLSFLNIKHSIKMTVDEGQDRNFLNLYPTDLQSPGTVLSPRYIRELELVKKAGANVLLTGNGGDEMCWGHSLAYTQRFKQGDISVVGEVLKACPKLGVPRLKTVTNLFVKPLLPELLLKLVGSKNYQKDTFTTPVWITDKAKELAHSSTQLDNPFDVKRDPVGYNRYVSLKTTSTYNAMQSYDKLAEPMGIQVNHPFFDTQVAEYSFAIPAKQLIQGAYPKWLLRYSMQNDLPNSVCWNIKKTTFDQHFGNLVRENAIELRQLLQDERMADMGLINQNLLLAEFDRVVANPNIPVQVDLLYAILTFSWLQTHFPE